MLPQHHSSPISTHQPSLRSTPCISKPHATPVSLVSFTDFLHFSTEALRLCASSPTPSHSHHVVRVFHVVSCHDCIRDLRALREAELNVTPSSQLSAQTTSSIPTIIPAPEKNNEARPTTLPNAPLPRPRTRLPRPLRLPEPTTTTTSSSLSAPRTRLRTSRLRQRGDALCPAGRTADIHTDNTSGKGP